MCATSQGGAHSSCQKPQQALEERLDSLPHRPILNPTHVPTRLWFLDVGHAGGCHSHTSLIFHKAKSHCFWKAEKIANPEQKLWSHFPCKDSEKEVIREKMVLKKTDNSPATPARLCRDDSPWLQAEQGRKANQGNTRETSISQVETAGTSLPRSGQAGTFSGSQPLI